MCLLSIKVPIRKKSGKLLKAPRIYSDHRRADSTESIEPPPTLYRTSLLADPLEWIQFLHRADLYIYTYIYIYTEREKERERQRQRQRQRVRERKREIKLRIIVLWENNEPKLLGLLEKLRYKLYRQYLIKIKWDSRT